MQRVVAHLTTAALWELVRTKEPYDPDEEDEAIAHELLDREGPGAIQHCLELEDPQRRGEWTHRLLEFLADKDQAKALELYLALPADCGTETERKMTRNLMVRKAAPVSADRLLATVDALAERGMLHFEQSSGMSVDYADGFDFRKTLDHLAEMPEGVEVAQQMDLCSAWAIESPLASLDWLQGHEEWQNAAMFGRDSLQSALRTIAVNSTSEKEEALLRTQQYYKDPKQRADFWNDLAASTNGYVDPEIAKIAAKIDMSQDYLAGCMERTRGWEEKDPGWAEVPSDLRDAAADKFLADWAAKDPSPKAEKARAHWWVTFDKASGK